MPSILSRTPSETSLPSSARSRGSSDSDHPALAGTPPLRRMTRSSSPPLKETRRTSIFSRLRRSIPSAPSQEDDDWPPMEKKQDPLPSPSEDSEEEYEEVLRMGCDYDFDTEEFDDEMDWERIKTLPRVRLIPPAEDQEEPIFLYPNFPKTVFTDTDTGSPTTPLPIKSNSVPTFISPFSDIGPQHQLPSPPRPSSIRRTSIASGSKNMWGGMSGGFTQPAPVFRRATQRPGSVVMPRKKEASAGDHRNKDSSPFSPPPAPGMERRATEPPLQDMSIMRAVLRHRFPSDPGPMEQYDRNDNTVEAGPSNIPTSLEFDPSTLPLTPPQPPLKDKDQEQSISTQIGGDETQQVSGPSVMFRSPSPRNLPPSPKDTRPRRNKSDRRKSRVSPMDCPIPTRPPPTPPHSTRSTTYPKTPAPLLLEKEKSQLKKQKSFKNFFFSDSTLNEDKRRKSTDSENVSTPLSGKDDKEKEKKNKEKEKEAEKDKIEGGTTTGMGLKKRFSLSNMSQAFKKRSVPPPIIPNVPDLPEIYKSKTKSGKQKMSSVPLPDVSAPVLIDRSFSAPISVEKSQQKRHILSSNLIDTKPVQSPFQTPTQEDDDTSDNSSLSSVSLEDIDDDPSSQQPRQARRATMIRAVSRSSTIGFDLQEMMGVGSSNSEEIIPIGPLLQQPLFSDPECTFENQALSDDQLEMILSQDIQRRSHLSHFSHIPDFDTLPTLPIHVTLPDMISTLPFGSLEEKSEHHCVMTHEGEGTDSDHWNSLDSARSSSEGGSSLPLTPIGNMSETIPVPSPSLDLTLSVPSSPSEEPVMVEIPPSPPQTTISPKSRTSTPCSVFSSPEALFKLISSPRSTRSSGSTATIQRSSPLNKMTDEEINILDIPKISAMEEGSKHGTQEYSSLAMGVKLRSLHFDSLGLDFENDQPPVPC
ncbi:hypothetical protein M231_05246 [Tremella mesenterica]|uniref:Uncharacterized protein n=1 Tax=Tremella mesenterica TaxID=5217 RepID=A0A4Q1BIS8_TREME|nr:hypothetical protein M231_05246 [Tremella mesenterica]